MVHVKLFGLLRLDTGLKELSAEADSVKALEAQLLEAAKQANPATKITAADIDGCIVVVNGKQSGKRDRLSDGDEVWLMSPVCGG